MDNKLIKNTDYNRLISEIGNLLNVGRKQMASAINTTMVQTYWNIGKYIVEYEQKGNERAEYGSDLINRLSRDLTAHYGKGFSKSNLLYIRKFYIAFQKSETVSHLLTWSHYFEILKKDDPLEISFYVKQCEIEGWSVRELKRQMQSMLFHRLAMSKDKEQVLKLSQEGQQIQKPEDILRDPYVFDFVGLPEKYNYTEKDLEDSLLQQFEMFLLELGKGFAFIGRQQRISLAGRHYYVDLVFYHRILKCFVLIDLKRGTIQHEDIGQMNLYINYYNSEMNVEGDNPPIGIVLGADADKLTMQYAMEGISNQLFAAKYQLYLPSREELQNQLDMIIRRQENDDNDN